MKFFHKYSSFDACNYSKHLKCSCLNGSLRKNIFHKEEEEDIESIITAYREAYGIMISRVNWRRDSWLEKLQLSLLFPITAIICVTKMAIESLHYSVDFDYFLYLVSRKTKQKYATEKKHLHSNIQIDKSKDKINLSSLLCTHVISWNGTKMKTQSDCKVKSRSHSRIYIYFVIGIKSEKKRLLLHMCIERMCLHTVRLVHTLSSFE